MDSKRRASLDWLPAHMPGVVALVAQKRRELGNAHVSECWKRGVVLREPGWFWAAEGALMVGTLWPELLDDPVMRHYIVRGDATCLDRAMLVIKPLEALGHGTT